jgi:hypothetical protein
MDESVNQGSVRAGLPESLPPDSGPAQGREDIEFVVEPPEFPARRREDRGKARRREKAQPSPAPEPLAEPPKGAGPVGAEEKPKAASTVTLRFDERGQPLKAEPETIERAREWLRLQGVAEAEPEPPELPAPVPDEQLAEHLWDGVAYLQAFLLRALPGLPFDKALELARLKGKEREELVPLTARVLQKWVPGLWRLAGDVTGLVMRTAVVEANKLGAIQAEFNKGRKEGK